MSELVADVVLNCTGGTPTLAGNPIPQFDLTILLNTNVTSRIVGTSTAPNASEALVTIDEPFPSAPVPNIATPGAGVPLIQSGCFTNQYSQGSGNCPMYGVLTGAGVNALSPGNPAVGNNGPYRGFPYISGNVTSNSYNVFQGVQNGVNSIAWNGIPIDPPGNNGTRTIRITNVRANAAQLGLSHTLVPSLITMTISITGSQAIAVDQPTQIVATVLTGPVFSNGSAAFQECQTVNGNLLGLSDPGIIAPPLMLTATEAFAEAFKIRNFAQVASAPTGPLNALTFPNAHAPNSPQNVIGRVFYIDTEAGIILPGSTTGTLAGLGTASGNIGVADSGTNITFKLTSIPSAVSLFVPSAVGLFNNGLQTGLAVLAGANSGPETSAGISLKVESGTAEATYEVVYSNSNVIETISVPLTIAYLAGVPASSVVQIEPGLTPFSTIGTADSSSPIPRFAEGGQFSLFNINACGNCAFVLSSTSITEPASGGTGSFSFTASDSSCVWGVVSGVPWIAVTSTPSSGMGNGSISYSVAANTGAARTGTITVAGQTFTIHQSAAAPVCNFSLTPSSAVLPAQGGTVVVTVNASDAGCAWSAASQNDWITFPSQTSGTGNGSIQLAVAPGSVLRDGSATVAGQTFTIRELAPVCTPDNLSFCPTFSADKTVLEFVYQRGQPVPVPQAITLSSDDGSLRAFTVESFFTSWLSATPAMATTPGRISITVNPAGLASGVYEGYIMTLSPGAIGPLVTVRLTVYDPPQFIAIPSKLTFTAPGSEILYVTASGRQVQYTVTVSDTWLQVAPASGNSPVNLSISVSSLPSGTYNGSITLLSPDARSLVIPVTYTAP